MTLRDLFEQFCVRRLASVLYECVAFSHADRAEADWLTAEEFVRKNQGAVNIILKRLISRMPPAQDQISGGTLVDKVPFDINYDKFVSMCGRDVWDLLYQPLKRWLGVPHDPPRPHYTHIIFA